MADDVLGPLFAALQKVQLQSDWRAALEALFVSMRGTFMFDNVAIFRLDSRSGGTEVMYARAVGRGKTAEADVAWGQELAAEVLAKRTQVVREPRKASGQTDRLQRPHLLGLPLLIGGSLAGALVFIRFGGPEFTEAHLQAAALIAYCTAALVAHRDLQDARWQLESVQRQMRLQDDFVSTISHELRTPLGFIKGYTTSLLRQDTTWDSATQREFLGIIDEESDRLTGLLDNMLQSARLQSNTQQFRFAPLRLDALVRDVAARVQSHKPDLQVTFDIGPVPAIQGDSNRLVQVFENLFTNALKYAPGSAIDIRMHRDRDRLHVTFADHGEGIPEEYLPFLFERFYRVPGDQGVTGTGLGLYICKQIVAAHRGKIWAESILDQGTTFHIALPLDGQA